MYYVHNTLSHKHVRAVLDGSADRLRGIRSFKHARGFQGKEVVEKTESSLCARVWSS